MQSFALVSSQRTVAAVDTPAPFAVAAAVESLGSSSVRHWSHGGQEFNFARNRRLFQDANCNTKLEMTSHPGLDNANISRDLRDLLTIPSHSFASYWRSPLFLGERNQFIADASSLYATFNPEFNGLYSLDGSLLLPPGSGSIPSGLVFTRNDLDVVLYGYIKHQEGGRMIGHALSGLRFADLAYGIDRILGGCGSALHKSTIPRPDVNLHLPEGLELLEASFSGVIHYGVVCKQNVIAKGSRFGPFRGKLVNTSEIKTNDDNSHMWEIFEDGKLSHFVDGRGSASSCWLTYVNCARYAEEQNMVALQFDGQIYYEACKEIRPDSELLVWYGDDYLQFMGIPMSLKHNPFGSETTFGGESESGEGYQCDHCGKVFAYRYYRDKHLKYTRCVDQGDRKYPCHLCTRSFEKRDRLRIHVLHVHEKHQPHKCVVCGKSFSQSSSLNKHMRVHSGERPYKCVYCSKAFTASSILRTHIRQHSGEKPFKCKHCGKAFASHAAHDSHVRRTHAQLAAADGSTKRSQAAKVAAEVCGICGMTFQQQCELKFHLKLHNPAILDYCMLPPGSTLPEESATPPSPAPRPTATSRSQTQQQRERYLHAQQMDVQLKNHAWFQEKLKN